MKFLVTGSAGLIGQNVVHDLVKLNQEIYSVYHNDKPIEGTPIVLDLTNLEKTRLTVQEIKPDVVIHLAAMTNVELCETEYELAHTINSKATETLAKECAKINAFFLFVSTDYIFDGNKGMKKEEDIPNPLGNYGKTKLEGELSLNNLASNWAIARTSCLLDSIQKRKAFQFG